MYEKKVKCKYCTEGNVVNVHFNLYHSVQQTVQTIFINFIYKTLFKYYIKHN